MLESQLDREFENQLEALERWEALKREKMDMLAIVKSNSPAELVKTRSNHEKEKNSLKSDLKKTTAFVKKIRTINAEGIQQCIRDSETLNLTLYISEIVVAISETNYKATDVPSMVKLCICLHRRYSEFTVNLVSNLKSVLFSQPNEDDKEFGKKKRILIRFVIELYQVGVWTDSDFFVELLRNLLGKSKNKNIKQPMDLLGFGTFIKYGSEILLGFATRKMHSLIRSAGRMGEELPVKLLAPPSACQEMQTIVTETYNQLCEDLIKAHKEYKTKERKSEKDKLLHGSLTEQKQNELDQSKRLFEKLHSSIVGLAECSDFEIPILVEEKEEIEENKGISMWDGGNSNNAPPTPGDFGPYGDAESKSFYTELPDLLALVPLSSLGFTQEQATALRDLWKKVEEEKEKDALGKEGNIDQLNSEIASSSAEEEVDDDELVTDDGEENINSKEIKEIEESKSLSADDPQARMTILLQEKLLEVVNKQKADEFCVTFCNLNCNKVSRKRLQAALLKMPRSRSELTSSYSRIIATMQRIFPDFSKPILEALRKEFYGQTKNNKPSQYIENRLRNIRFTSELIKFNICPPIFAFRMFDSLLSDFSSNNVELVAVLLDSCGRYLYLLPITFDRISAVLDTIMRLSRVKFLDLRQQAVLEMAYFSVKPPEKKEIVKVVYSQVQRYARFLVCEKLDQRGVSVDAVIDSAMRLPWMNPEEQIELTVVSAAFQMARTKYTLVPTLADFLSGFSRAVPNLCIRLVDRVIEELQRSLEIPHRREPQSLLGLVRLIGEFYNFSVLSSHIVFDFLYHVINFGHQVVSNQGNTASTTNVQIKFLSPSLLSSSQYFDPRVPSDSDSPTDLFRAQIVCELLNTCGSYFVYGRPKEKLSKFLLYFQRYLLSKTLIPFHIEMGILDCFENLETLARNALHEKKGVLPPSGNVFPLYSSIDDIQPLIQVLENKVSVDGENDEEDDEEEERAQQDRHHKSVDGNAEVETEDKSEDEGNDNDNGDDEVDDSVSDAAAARMLESMRTKEEDEEFEKAFKNLMMQSVESVKGSSNVKATIDINRMAIPAVLPKPKNVSTKMQDDEDDDDEVKPASKGMAFKLLGRDNKGRIESRQLIVPDTAKMAIRLVQAEAANKLEKQRIKEKVLQISEKLNDMGDEVYSRREQMLNDKKPINQTNIISSKYSSNNNSSGGGSGVSNKFKSHAHYANNPGERRDEKELNLNEFLAVSSAAEVRKLSERRN